MIPRSIRNGLGFFSDYWLGSVLGSHRRGQLARLTSAQAEKLLRRLMYLRQRIDTPDPPDLTTFREKFARPLLGDIFGYSLSEPGEETRLRLLSSEGGPPLAAVLLVPEAEGLEGRANRTMIERALTDHALPYGFILTPEVLRLIRRPGDGHRHAYFDFALAAAAESADAESLLATWQIFRAGSLTPGLDSRRPIDILEEESRRQSAKVSEDLKEAVFTSAELLIRGFLEAARLRPERFTPEPPLSALRDAALQALYRILFILYAESRDERLRTHSFYLENYSLERLVDRLLHTRRDSLSGNRYAIWAHLLALFRVFDQGLPPLPGLRNIPPRGGTLFSEKTEIGAFLAEVRLPDRLAAELVLTLATSRPRRGVGRERVSFRELAIEQLGAVYEGLLEYEPRLADGTMIGVHVQGRDFVLAPSELSRLCAQKDLSLKGPAEIVAGTAAADLHPDLVEDDETDTEEADEDEEDTDSAADDEGSEDKGLKKGAAARLLRRYEAGDFYFTPGSGRKSSGSYYTPEEIVQYLVRHALGGLVEGKSVAEIESLRVIDPACGSAHFLVGAARFLGVKLHEAYRRELRGAPPAVFHPGRELSAEVRAEWEREGDAWSKRRVVERCLYGVDYNPTAVQLAQVALWIESLAGDRPLSFFDHHIRCGNSLLGTRLDRLHDPPLPTLPQGPGLQRGLFERDIDLEVAKALDERLLIDAPLPAGVRKDTPDEYLYKADRLRRAGELEAHARLLFDLRNAAAFLPAIWADWHTVLQARDLATWAKGRPWWPEFLRIRDRERFFHWELEFPEVFRGERKGFDAVLGNPPWEKVKPDRKEFYGRYDLLIRAYAGGELDARIRELHKADPPIEHGFEQYSERIKTLAGCLKKGGDYHFVDWEVNGRSTGGDPDLFKFFVERGHWILRVGGRLGFLVPGAIYNNEGCTGLRHLLLDESRVISFYGFENKNKIFNIHPNFKLVNLVFEKVMPEDAPTGADGTRTRASDFHAAFLRYDVDELAAGPPPGVTVHIRRAELDRLSPGTLAFFEFRSERDREIVLKMYDLHPGQTSRHLLGDRGADTWNALFTTEFHMTNDRDLWTRPDGRLWTPKEILGREQQNFADTRAAMAEKGFWPLYEGKMMNFLTVNIRPIQRWVSLEAARAKYRELPESGERIAFREVARNVDSRTVVTTMIPERAFCNHKLWVLKCDPSVQGRLLALLASFSFDYMIRLRHGSAGLSASIMSRAAVPPPSSLPTGLALHCFDQNADGDDSVFEREDQWAAHWEVNKAVAEAYGLTRDDLEHILNSFPLFARQYPGFFAFLHERIRGWNVA